MDQIDQPLTSSDHLGGGAGEAAEAGVRPEEEGEGRRLFSLGLGGSAASSSSERDTPAARCGLLTVAEIISQDLRTVMWHASGLTMLYLLVGGIWLMISDKWNFTEAVYFMTTSLLTIGYGDVTVSSKGLDRLIDSCLILLALVAVAIWAACASRVVQAIRTRPAEGPAVDFDAEAAIQKLRWLLASRVVLLSVVILVGTLVFMAGEGVGFVSGFYWAVVTSSSIGYGDVVPSSSPMRWFTTFYGIVAVGSMLETLRVAGAYPFEVCTLRAEGKVYEQFTKARSASERAAAAAAMENAVTELLEARPEAQPGGAMGRSDVALSMLLLLNRVSYDDVQQATRIFDKLGDRPPFPLQTAVGPERSKKK